MTKRAELIIIFSCALLFFICFFVHPVFPVQRYPLFADAPKFYDTYIITTPEGVVVSPSELNLQNTYDGDPTYLVGRLPTTVYKWGQSLSFSELQNHFKSEKAGLTSQYPVLCLTRTTWATLPDKSFGARSFTSFALVNQELTSDNNVIQSVCNHRGQQ
ncbi:hypothetical protein B9G69_015070 [Bdellovibrio sp. SKB1291214]|uniref:hypothetical protein n=1 Tax=Bdellovibrio sp. SKB1291214 TaxID=1732569 RepID=UPI000B51969E|nr:hypothetical protein [Bdellovibrio sp. SKB1291214]UYL08362.1 hypothetical protein B9G69_015070 [Bdellovibrio sp. SKB1291214]